MSRSVLCILAVLVAMFPGAALAREPVRALSQFKHRAWTVEDHAPAGIWSIVQAGDGYLLLGAGEELYRFDGVKFELLPRPVANARGDGKAKSYTQGNNEVSSLLLRKSGEVWVSYEAGPMAVYRNGVLQDLSDLSPDGVAVEIAEDGEGRVWAGLVSGSAFLARHADGTWQAYGDESDLNPENVYDIVPGRDGVIWVMTAHTLQYLREGDTRFQPTGEYFPRGAALTQDADGVLWISDSYRGTRRLPDYLKGATAPERPQGPRPVVEQAIRKMLVGRDGAIWGVTQSRGLFRVASPDPGGAATPVAEEERFGYRDGLTSDIATTIYEDREGNIWVGTTSGLDQFRAASIVAEPTVPRRSYFGYGLFSDVAGKLFITDSSTIHVVDGKVPISVVASGFTHLETVCDGADGAVYVTMKEDMVRLKDGALTHVKLPPDYVDFESCVRDDTGALWFTVGHAGIRRLDEAGWQEYPLPPDRPDAWASNLAVTSEGVLAYFNTRGLVRIDTQPWTTIVSEEAIGVGQVLSLHPSREGLLIGGRKGLARFRDGKIDRLTLDAGEWDDAVQGIAQTEDGETWLLGQKGLAHVATATLTKTLDSHAKLDALDRFDISDGMPGPIGIPGSVRDIMAAGPDGRIWLGTTESLAWIDPAHLVKNPVAPPVYITSLTADGQRQPHSHGIRLSAGTENIEIAYTALSLTIPERVKFRYRLEGVDRDWIDAGSRREAFYTKLGPGDYVFHVMASNNDGVWNETGATLTFTVPPTFVQSPLFLALCLIAASLVLWILYRLRVRQVAYQMRRRLEERLGERERIARELHDTLLQGFQGLILRFQAATNAIPASHDARRMMEVALDQADNVIIEGRDRVRDLRSTHRTGDLAGALSDAAGRLCPGGIQTVVREEGKPRDIHPGVFEEVLRIGEEAFSNAGRHSGATAIDIELAYEPRCLRMSIRDNGVGIDPGIVEAGRAGHFGLVGMRERAARIAAEFTILSRPAAGAEVVLIVPAASAYKSGRTSPWASILERLAPVDLRK